LELEYSINHSATQKPVPLLELEYSINHLDTQKICTPFGTRIFY